MAFDDTTRGRLQKLVNSGRRLLLDEFSIQLQQTYGLNPKTGEVTPMARLTHLDDRERHTAEVLRQTVAHYLGAEADDTGHRIAVLDRMVREQAFTVFNRLAALLMMEARGQLIQSVSQGYQSRGYQLYSKIAGTALGETGRAYQIYLFSLFDELAQELPDLFDRYAAHGLLFPRETALRALLDELNHFEIEPLWAEDETIGWIYQYFNSKEERKAMREASQAPRNSRELAVRNQFFTPRYVVEFLVDNTLGRLWFNATGGSTDLRERCQYLLVKPDEQPQAAVKLRDPRSLKLLDPACGSMHFGLYAFDLFAEIYREAWVWEQQHGPGSLTFPSPPVGEGPGERGQALKPLCLTYADEVTFQRDIPRLIIEHNIYGVDIDPRAAQIASLALWLRAQRAWHEAGVKAKVRPLIGRGHVVAAVAPPAERALRQQFAANLDLLDAELFEKTLQLLKGLPELGVLLRVERELPHLIRQVYIGKGTGLFAQQEQESWRQAEARLHTALIEFAHAAQSTYQGQLFAQDALQGLRLIDLCREVFDVVVMNPPFGAVSLGVKEYLTEAYPDSRNDLLGIFVDRGLNLLRRGGRLGAITSRTCFFLTSFTEWRKKVVLGLSSVEVIADLGQGVMDDAMVEAAAYVLERGAAHPTTNVIRAIADENRHLALNECVLSHRLGSTDSRIFQAEKKTFDLLPGSPFVYWVDTELIEAFNGLPSFESIGDVNVGLSTADNPRFVRLSWEVHPHDHNFVYYPTKDDFCSFDDPVVVRYLKRKQIGDRKWNFFVMAGASQPWFAPMTSMVNWASDGNELFGFFDPKTGKRRATIRNPSYYFRPGFSWTRRAVRFYPYVIPGNCIHSASRYMAFPESGREAEALGLSASRLSSAFMRFYAEFWQRPNFLVENLKMLPWPSLTNEAKDYLSALITSEVQKRREAYQNFEPFHEFVLPGKIHDYSNAGAALAFDRHSLIGEEGERLVADAYGFSPIQAQVVERDLREAIIHQHGAITDTDDEESSAEDSDFVLDISPYATEEAHISYLLGCAFGRWDIRFATGQRQPESLPDPFVPSPVCPPGMLQNERRLPAKEHELPEGYPLPIAWSGVLVEDEGHPGDVVERVQYALRIIWKDRADSIEERASAQLGEKSLRDYLRCSNGFFADHLKRYTKSSRKAPIYWPLSTASGSYTLWVYYPSLSNQTLFSAVNDFLDGPNGKLTQVSRECAELRMKGSGRSRDEENRYATLQAFEQELTDLRDILLKIAPTYQPNHDDGVQITAAPLWSLFRHKPWQKVLKDTWVKLEKGDYDWAHLAMAYWPERVREKCKTDKSLAIAHGLEDLYVEPEAKPKKTRGRKKSES